MEIITQNVKIPVLTCKVSCLPKTPCKVQDSDMIGCLEKKLNAKATELEN